MHGRSPHGQCSLHSTSFVDHEFEITLLCPCHLHNVYPDTVFKKEAIGGSG